MEGPKFMSEGRGRSALKRAAKAVEELARQLVSLSEADADKVPFNENVRDEFYQARTTKGHSARRRQLKHFAGCLRREESQRAAAEAFLDGQRLKKAVERYDLQKLEAWRDRLCDPRESDSTLSEIGQQLPQADLNKLAGLARSVQASGDKKAAREIFRRLRQANEGQRS